MIVFENGTFQVDAETVAAGLGLPPEEVIAGLRNGTITSASERGLRFSSRDSSRPKGTAKAPRPARPRRRKRPTRRAPPWSPAWPSLPPFWRRPPA